MADQARTIDSRGQLTKKFDLAQFNRLSKAAMAMHCRGLRSQTAVKISQIVFKINRYWFLGTNIILKIYDTVPLNWPNNIALLARTDDAAPLKSRH